MLKETWLYVNKAEIEEDSELTNMVVNTAGFRYFKLALQMLYEEGNVVNTFVKPQRYKVWFNE